MSVKVCCGECGTKTEVVENFRCPVCAPNSGSANTSTNSAMAETALFEDIYELLCGVNLDKKDSVIAKVNARIVQLRQ